MERDFDDDMEARLGKAAATYDPKMKTSIGETDMNITERKVIYITQRAGQRIGKPNPLLDWKVWAITIALTGGFFAFAWLASVGCILLGGTSQVCGL